MQHRGIMVQSKLVGEAVQTVARENGFHPILDKLNALKWDGTPRLEA